MAQTASTSRAATYLSLYMGSCTVMDGSPRSAVAGAARLRPDRNTR